MATMENKESRKRYLWCGCVLLPLLLFIGAGWVFGSIFSLGRTVSLPGILSPDGKREFSVIYGDSGALGDMSTSGTIIYDPPGWFSRSASLVFDTDSWIWEDLHPKWLDDDTLELHVRKGVTFEIQRTQVEGVTIIYKEMSAPDEARQK